MFTLPCARERENVRRRQVLDVDVVTDRGAVGRLVVGPIHLDVRGVADRRPQHVRDQMCLGVVVLPGIAACSCDVEVAQAHRAQPIGAAEVADHPIDRELRSAVRVRRQCRRVLRYRDLIGLAVDRRRRGEDEQRDGRGHHRLEQIQGASDVGAVVTLGPGNRLTHERQRGEVQDAIEALAQRTPDGLGVA